ncbi:MAG: hypothetical protein JWM68_242 [Verrucomicrobiales bacterium]|nr:hypothetical protein [Verrucomicrobiales bacterium]
MAANRYLMIRAIALAALRQKTESKTPLQLLEDVVIGKYTSEIVDGKTVIGTDEAGGSVSFALIGGFTPDEILGLVMETIVWINSQEDPEDYPPYPPRRIKRMRVSFEKATI